METFSGLPARHDEAPEVVARPAALAARGLRKVFGDKVAVAGFDLAVPAGSFFGLVGPNGAGKSTTIGMMTGMLRPDAGAVRIGDGDVWTDPQAVKRRIGVLPEDLRLIERLTGRELLHYLGAMRELPSEEVVPRADELLSVFELDGDATKLIADFSTGMRKKMGLAAALLHAPEVLFLDEPFESVDPVSVRTIRTVLERYTAGGGTILFSSHVMAVVEQLCDRVGIMHDGRLVAAGRLDDVRQGRRLEDVFIDLVGASLPDDDSLTWLQRSSG